MEYLPYITPINYKKPFRYILLINQIRFIALLNHTANELDLIVTVTDMGSIGSNNINSRNEVKVISILEASIIPTMEICIRSSSNYNINSNIDIGTSINLGDTVVCLDILLAMIIDLASF